MMIIYILDENYRENYAIDNYESFIWTERFAEPGDFELKIEDNPDVRSRLIEGTLLSIRESNRMMIVQDITEDRNDSGTSRFTYTGPSFEAVLEDRIAYSDSISSYKSRMNDLVIRSSIDAIHNPNDKIPKLYRGTNVMYPSSAVAPSLDPTPYDHHGWGNVLDLHDDAASQFPIGYRIVRDADDPDKPLYYDNYTGFDRTTIAQYPEPKLEWLFENPYFLESDKDVVVWTNLAQNPGFETLYRCLTQDDAEFNTGASSSVSSVEVDYSVSGKGLKITPKSDATSSVSSAYLNGYKQPTTTKYFGEAWAGKKLTVTATIEVLKKQTGEIWSDARCILVTRWNSAGTSYELAKSATASNTTGTKKELSVTFTVPSSAYTWSIRLTNGSRNNDEEVIWSDLTVVELPSNPVGYFDGGYSPDTDLVPRWLGDSTDSRSVLVGRSIQGVDSTSGGVLIQSKNWSVHHGISARLIRNTDAGNTPYQPYAVLRLRGEADRVEASVYQTEKLTALSDFGKIGINAVANTSSSKSNTANTSQDQEYYGILGSSMRLYGGFSNLGGSLYFDVAIASKGKDQPVKHPLEPVIFSERNDDFISSQTYWSHKDYKNVAYVTHGTRLVEVDEGHIEDEARKIIWVDASDLELKGRALLNEMELLGREALKKHRATFMIDGVSTQFARYEYDKDYFLGDVVLVGNHRGQLFPLQVTEYIFVMDAEGFRSYPTFTEQTDVSAGVWYSPEYNIEWDAGEHLGTWQDQP